MAASNANPEVDAFFDNATTWRAEMERLRAICLECGLAETLKWDKPTYTIEDKNVVQIQGFKAYCALLFFKGYLIEDPDGLLVKTGPNTKVGRQARYTDLGQIDATVPALKRCIEAAITVEQSGTGHG
ncbi:MAG TPA: DUF1801 domain-containing protein [Thermomicrobiales bacterium]|nr:DUF1801 domain-containing protein [Thermomicrobiales bacterium]